MRPLRFAHFGALCIVVLALLPAARPATASEQITLMYLRHNYMPGVNLEKKLAVQFHQLHPNITINFSVLGSEDDVNQKVLISYAGGGAPDIILTFNGYFPQYAGLGFLQPIQASVFGASSNRALASQWVKGTLNGWLYQGQYYGVPDEASDFVTAISPNLFRKAGLDPVKDAPRTWEDIARIGPKLTKTKNGAIVQQGFGMPSYPGVMTNVFDSMIWQLGGRIVSADGSHATLNSPAGVKALQTLSDFVNKYKISVLAGKPLQGPGFNTGNTAMIADVGTWYPGFLASTSPKIYDNGNGVKILPFPRFKGGKDEGGVLYGFAWTVNAHSPHAKEAWEWIKFLNDHAMDYYKFGQLLPTAAMLKNPKVMADPAVALEIKEQASGAPFTTLPNQVNTIVYSAVTRTILDRVPAKASLDQAAQELNSLLPTLKYKITA